MLLVEQSPSRITNFIFGASSHWWLRTDSAAQSSLIPASALKENLLNNGYQSKLIYQSANQHQGGGYLLFCQVSSLSIEVGIDEQNVIDDEPLEYYFKPSLDVEMPLNDPQIVSDSEAETWLMIVSQTESLKWRKWWSQLQSSSSAAQAITFIMIECENINVDDFALFFDAQKVQPSRIIDASYESNSGLSYQHASNRADFLRNLFQYLQTLPAEKQPKLDPVSSPHLTLPTIREV